MFVNSILIVISLGDISPFDKIVMQPSKHMPWYLDSVESEKDHLEKLKSKLHQ